MNSQDNSRALLIKAAELHNGGNFAEAERFYKEFLGGSVRDVEVVNYLGIALREQGKLDEAISLLNEAAAQNPDYAETHNSLGNIYERKMDMAAAANSYARAAKISPSYVYFYNQSIPLYNLYRFSEAESALHEAIKLNPGLVQAYINLALTLANKNNFAEAEKSCLHALELSPNTPVIYYNLATIYEMWKRIDKAAETLEKLLQIAPGHVKAQGLLLFQYQQLCMWGKFEPLKQKINAAVSSMPQDAGYSPLSPFSHVTFCDDPAENLKVARAQCRNISEQAEKLKSRLNFIHKKAKKDKLTIGYLSADLRDHAVGHITKYMFGLHDKKRFNIHAYSTGSNDGSECRKIIKNGCNKFVDCHSLSDEEVVRKIYDDGVDILVEMTGHTAGNRLLISALRPAPIAVNLWGFTGSIGADFIDYIITDEILTPPEHQKYYAEKFAYIPNCFQINHPHEKISNEKKTRKDFGLPEDKFIFVANSQSYKIDQRIFDLWLRLLQKLPDSVLLIRQTNEIATEQMKKYAASKGMGENRIIFSGKLPSRADYFKRLSLADLALDTPIYNGGSTTTDALWAGLPVVTSLGNHFASRMAASFINGVGMYDELVVNSLEEYEEKALELANNSEKLKTIREKLWKNRTTQQLFNLEKFMRHLEASYENMWGEWLNKDQSSFAKATEDTPTA